MRGRSDGEAEDVWGQARRIRALVRIRRLGRVNDWHSKRGKKKSSGVSICTVVLGKQGKLSTRRCGEERRIQFACFPSTTVQILTPECVSQHQ